MKRLPLYAASFAFLMGGSAFGQDRLVTGFPDLPKDVQDVAERSVACQHFWGEANGTGDERDREVARTLKQLKCDRVTRDLELMQSKYANDHRVITILKEAAVE